MMMMSPKKKITAKVDLVAGLLRRAAMTANLDGDNHLFTDYLMLVQFRWCNLK